MAKNEHGVSNPVVDEFQTSEVPPVAVPSGVKVNITMATEVHLTWEQPVMASAVAYYTVRYSGLMDGVKKEITSARYKQTLLHT